MKQLVKVRLKKKTDESYDIVIEHGLFKKLGRQIVHDGFGNKYCIITDSCVEKILCRKLLMQLRKSGAKAEFVSFPAGEKHKNLESVHRILEKMAALGFDRKDCVISLGGGVVGDVAGFCAAVYFRGINFVQVPTTLLAMVDSSIGGKTGVNLGIGKNLVGSFRQPEKVYICPELLESLPTSEVRNGLSEVVKHAVVSDRKFFSYLEKNCGHVLALDRGIMPRVIRRNCQIKAKVVKRDETESNYRKVVNYGHTIGHALEALGKYTALSHGEAISIGMVVEAVISHKLGLMPSYEVMRIRSLLRKICLPVSLPCFDPHRIVALTRKDKKAVSGKVHYSLPERIGRMHNEKGAYALQVPDKVVLAALEDCR